MKIRKSMYCSLSEWRKAEPKAYEAAKIKNFLIEICNSFGWKSPKIYGYWTKERVLAEAKKYITRKDWSKNSRASYKSATRNGWLEEATAHMIKLHGYWNNKENVLADAKKYKTRSEWVKNSSGSYSSATRNGWLKEASVHMKSLIKPSGYWNNKENVLAEAKIYPTRKDWVKNSNSSYTSAVRNGWLKEATVHMKSLIKPSGYWIKERVLAEAKKFPSRKQWRKRSNHVFIVAKKNGWLKEASVHMEALL